MAISTFKMQQKALVILVCYVAEYELSIFVIDLLAWSIAKNLGLVMSQVRDIHLTQVISEIWV